MPTPSVCLLLSCDAGLGALCALDKNSPTELTLPPQAVFLSFLFVLLVLEASHAGELKSTVHSEVWSPQLNCNGRISNCWWTVLT